MKKSIFPLLVAVMTVALITAAPSSSAQEVQKGFGMNMPAFAEFDLNGDGTITVPERPGLGFRLNEDVVRQYRVEPH